MSSPTPESAAPTVDLKENTSNAEDAHSPGHAPKVVQTATSRLAAIIPKDIMLLFTDPPLLSTEDRESHLTFILFLIDGIKPRDPIEYIFVSNIADLYLESRRLRRFKVGAIELTRFKPAEIPTNPAAVPKDLFAEFYKLCEDSLALAQEPLATEIDSARAFLGCIGAYAGADRLLESTESRLNEIFRQLRIHRESLSRAHSSTNDVIDAEYSEASASRP